jgi:cell division transport system permease protein
MSHKKIGRWLENHLRAFLFGLGELLRAPVASAITLLVIGIAMTFPAGLYALLQNGQKLAEQWDSNPTISLYLQPHTQEAQALALIKQLQQRDDIANVSYISPEQGLKEFQQQSAIQSALRTLPENPLPGIIVITPRINLQSSTDSQNFLASLKELPNVDTSQLDTLWIQRVYELMTLGQRITYGLMFLFGIGVALIVGNTMRMATQSHRQEIMVLRLVGATPAFIRRPMLYRGALYGMLGGFIACLLVDILFWWLQAPAQRLAESYYDHWRLQGPDYTGQLTIIIACALLGLMGAWFSVQNYLRTPEEV